MIASGHPPAEVWGYTPVQVQGFAELAERRERRNGVRFLSRSAFAFRGEAKDVNRAIRRDWDD